MHFGPRLRVATFAAILLASVGAPAISPGFAAEEDGASGQPVTTLATNSPESLGKGKPHQEPRHIREGTVFQNVTGRFSMIGSRWVFIPQREVMPETAASELETKELGQKRSTAIVFESRNGSGREISITTSTQPTRQKLVKEYAPDDTTITAADLPQLVVTENLMLQRVVEAIRTDSSEATWIVSGEVKEYFDDNVLMLRAAQRAIAIAP